LAFWLACAAVAATGCTQLARIEVSPSGCVNPAGGQCPVSGSAPDSRILELRLYQLKEVVDPCRLDLAAFVDGGDQELDVLKSALADSQHKELVRRVEQVEASKSKALARWPLQPATRYILAVAAGRRRDKNTFRVLPRELFLDGAVLYVRGTNLCVAGSCESTIEEQCP
jgi:uncharacterized protein with PhoU and TrkA domain